MHMINSINTSNSITNLMSSDILKQARHELFESMDTNDDGALGFDELESSLSKRISQIGSAETTDEFIARVDQNDDGILDKDEFLAAKSIKPGGLKTSILKMIWQSFSSILTESEEDEQDESVTLLDILDADDDAPSSDTPSTTRDINGDGVIDERDEIAAMLQDFSGSLNTGDSGGMIDFLG